MNADVFLEPATLNLSISEIVTQACIWEVTAAKPGNVYRGADFEDMSFSDFLTSAILIGPILQRVDHQGVGKTIKEAAIATRQAVNTNTNLGILLLITPLAKVPLESPLEAGINEVLADLDTAETKFFYEAIQIAQPGGLGSADQADINSSEVPNLPLVEVMRLAADKDTIAKQYDNGFKEVFWMARLIEDFLTRDLPLSEALVHAYLEFLAKYPDSLIVRKCGKELASRVSARAEYVLQFGSYTNPEFQLAVKELDFWLRSDGNKRNPGTTADMIAAGLFVILRENRLQWPVKFYRDSTSL